jgi:GTP-binding protein EngB required for normal cell division
VSDKYVQVADGKSALRDAESKATEYKNKTGTELNKAIDKFDKTVEDKAAQAKGGISSWFGGK